VRVLVTGGAGYVGSTTAQRLIEAGHTVVVFDSLAIGHRDAVPPGAQLVVGDVLDQQAVENALTAHQIDAVLHCSALSLVGESVREPARYYQNNVVGGVRLLDAMRAAGVRRIVFSSSAAVYGVPDSTPIEETAQLRPINPYGDTKRSIEGMLTSYTQAYGMAAVSLRYFNACGATDLLGEDHDPETHLIPNVLAAVMRGDPITIFGDDYPTADGTCVRDYVHVDDLAAGHLAALEFTAGAENGHSSFNLGSGNGFSNLQVVDAAEKVVGRPIQRTMGARRAGDPPTLVAGNTSARDVLGWEPRHGSLDEIIGSAWRWRVDHPNGYEPNS
jgi:UDP-glucose-4-epimerase GalE